MSNPSPLVVLWPNYWHDGIMSGLGLYEHQPVYFSSDDWCGWEAINQEDISKYSPNEVAQFSFEFGVYIRPVPRTFRLYQLTIQQFAQEELFMRLCHRLGPGWFQSACQIDTLSPPVRLEDWRQSMGQHDYTYNPYVATVDEDDLIMPSSRSNFKVYPNYWLYFHTLTATCRTNTPLMVDWNTVKEWKLVRPQLLRYLARTELHRTPQEISRLSYDELCHMDTDLWHRRRRILAKLAHEARSISPIIIYQPGSRWVQPAMRDHFRPIPVEPKPIHWAYRDILTECNNRVSRGYLLFLANRVGLLLHSRSTPEVCRYLQNYVTLSISGR
jgi:hypothetical protein